MRGHVLEHLLVGRDRVGELLHQLAEFVDLADQRFGHLARAVHRGGDLALHPDDPPVEFGNLPADVGGGARKVGDLAADVEAVALAAGDRVDHHERGHHRDAGDRRLHAGEPEREVGHDARRNGDHHHAERNKRGAQAPHVRPQGPPNCFCMPTRRKNGPRIASPPMVLTVHEQR